MASGATTSSLTARFLGSDLLERARANALSCPLWQDGALVAPTEAGSTVTIWDGSGAKQVDAAAVTVTASIATYNYTPAASIVYGEGWRVEWSLIVNGITHVFRNDGALVRVVLYSPITDADLFRRVSSLDPSGQNPISSVTDYQDYLDDAHTTIQLRLVANGNRPNLILSPSSLRECYVALTLALIFDDFSTRLNETYSDRADEYRRQYERAWGGLRFTYAPDDEDTSSASLRRRTASPTVWLTSRRG
jgi:hypothetical protein